MKSKYKLQVMLLTFVIAIGLMAFPVSAESNSITVDVINSGGTQNIQFNESTGYPFINNKGCVYCPIEPLAKALGLNFTWNKQDNSIVITENMGDASVASYQINSTLKVGSNEVVNEYIYHENSEGNRPDKHEVKNGTLPSKVVEMDGKVYGPVRYLVAVHGYDAVWNNAGQHVTITRNPSEISFDSYADNTGIVTNIDTDNMNNTTSQNNNQTSGQNNNQTSSQPGSAQASANPQGNSAAPSSSDNGNKVTRPKTADDFPLGFYLTAAIVGAGVIVVLVYVKQRKSEK